MNILTEKPVGFQLETAINDWMMRKGKAVYWMQTTTTHIIKIKKWGFVRGILKDLRMTFFILSWGGIAPFVKQLFFFARDELLPNAPIENAV